MPPFHVCYFVTIATACRFKTLGRLGEGGVQLSPLGHQVVDAWNRIGDHRSWVSTGAFVVMPDHVHGILWWDAVPRNRPTSVSIIIGGFKGDATRTARRAGLLRGNVLLWQEGFSVRDIRTPGSFERASHYVEANPAVAWAKMIGSSAAPASPPPEGGGSATDDRHRSFPASPPPDGGGSATDDRHPSFPASPPPEGGGSAGHG